MSRSKPETILIECAQQLADCEKVISIYPSKGMRSQDAWMVPFWSLPIVVAREYRDLTSWPNPNQRISRSDLFALILRVQRVSVERRNDADAAQLANMIGYCRVAIAADHGNSVANALFAPKLIETINSYADCFREHYVLRRIARPNRVVEIPCSKCGNLHFNRGTVNPAGNWQDKDSQNRPVCDSCLPRSDRVSRVYSRITASQAEIARAVAMRGTMTDATESRQSLVLDSVGLTTAEDWNDNDDIG
jgi:hypothetical protein